MEKSNSTFNSNSNSNHNNNHRNLHKQNNSNISVISDNDSFHSPLHSDSPLRSDDPNKSLSSRALVSVEKYYSPLRSPRKPSWENLSLPPTSEVGNRDRNSSPRNKDRTKVGPVSGGGGDVEGGGEVGREGGEGAGSTKSGLKVALGFRVCEFVLCLISFSVMASDKTEGWSGDSFDRYKEYRYCVAVNAIGFAYSGFQTFDLIYNLASRKHFLSHYTRYHFDFFMDQILAYLIMSASSSAATRAYDWISNWGKDEFTEMASASIGVSFLAFVAFAFSSLISGYNFFNRNAS
ncbi:CASP-like protein 4A3 [Capsicum chacoense]